MVRHILFLKWLLYIVFVSILVIIALYQGFFQLGFSVDHTGLSIIITVLWFLCEVWSGLIIFLVDKQFDHIKSIKKLLQNNPDIEFKLVDNSVHLLDSNKALITKLDKSWVSTHIENLIFKTQYWNNEKKRLSQSTLINSLFDRIHEKHGFPSWAGEMLMYLGLLGTMIGLIMIFHPFMIAGTLTVAALQAGMGQIFAGIAVAFFPGAFALAYNTLLNLNQKILSDGISDLEDEIVTISEKYILPKIETNNETNT